jgi:hypothetical protein
MPQVASIYFLSPVISFAWKKKQYPAVAPQASGAMRNVLAPANTLSPNPVLTSPPPRGCV